MPGILRKGDYSYSVSQEKDCLGEEYLLRFGLGRKVSRPFLTAVIESGT